MQLAPPNQQQYKLNTICKQQQDNTEYIQQESSFREDLQKQPLLREDSWKQQSCLGLLKTRANKFLRRRRRLHQSMSQYFIIFKQNKQEPRQDLKQQCFQDYQKQQALMESNTKDYFVQQKFDFLNQKLIVLELIQFLQGFVQSPNLNRREQDMRQFLKQRNRSKLTRQSIAILSKSFQMLLDFNSTQQLYVGKQACDSQQLMFYNIAIGKQLAYTLYALNLKMPQFYKPTINMLGQIIKKIPETLRFQCMIRKVVFLTQLYGNGFSISSSEFLESIYPNTYAILGFGSQREQYQTLFRKQEFGYFYITYIHLYRELLSSQSLFLPKQRTRFQLQHQKIIGFLLDKFKKMKKKLKENVRQMLKSEINSEQKKMKLKEQLLFELKTLQQFKSKVGYFVKQIDDSFQSIYLGQIDLSQAEQILKHVQTYLPAVDWKNQLIPYDRQIYLIDQRQQSQLLMKTISNQASQEEKLGFQMQLQSCRSLQKVQVLSAYYQSNLSSVSNFKRFLINTLFKFSENQYKGNVSYLTILIKFFAKISANNQACQQLIQREFKNLKIFKQMNLTKEIFKSELQNPRMVNPTLLKKRERYFQEISEQDTIYNPQKKIIFAQLTLLIELTKFKMLPSEYIIVFLSRFLNPIVFPMTQNKVAKVNRLISIIETLNRVCYYGDLELRLAIQKCLKKLDDIVKENVLLYGSEVQNRIKGIKKFLRSNNNIENQNHIMKISKKWKGIWEMQTKEDRQLLQIQNIQQQFSKALQICKKIILPFSKIDSVSKQNYKSKNSKIVYNQNEQKETKDINEKIRSIWMFIERKVEQKNYLTNYFYASLLFELDFPILSKMVKEKVKAKIMNILREQNLIKRDLQAAVCWMRFLGQLFNYDILSRKQFVAFIYQILEQPSYKQNSFQEHLKCILSALEASKYYLIEEKQFSSNNEVYLLLLKLKKAAIQNSPLQSAIIQVEFTQILQYFHKALVSKYQLNSVKKIQQFCKDFQSYFPQQSNKKIAKDNIYNEEIKYMQSVSSRFDKIAKQTEKINQEQAQGLKLQNSECIDEKKYSQKIGNVKLNGENKQIARKHQRENYDFERQMNQLISTPGVKAQSNLINRISNQKGSKVRVITRKQRLDGK